MIKTKNGEIFLNYLMNGRQGTVITIEIPADKIKFVTYVYDLFPILF